jgi:hypothetical protein
MRPSYRLAGIALLVPSILVAGEFAKYHIRENTTQTYRGTKEVSKEKMEAIRRVRDLRLRKDVGDIPLDPGHPRDYEHTKPRRPGRNDRLMVLSWL